MLIFKKKINPAVWIHLTFSVFLVYEKTQG